MTFKVVVEASPIEFPCEAEETILDAAERAGYALPCSCRKGVCATCEGELRSGEVALRSQHVTGPAGNLLLCQARPRSDLLIHPRRIQRREPDTRKAVTAKVYRIHRPVDDVAILQLRFAAGVRAKFRAGQYLHIKLRDGDTRNFSMANPPHESDGALLHIRHVPGGRFSEAVLTGLRPGDSLDIELPYGDFHLRPDSEKPVVCVATGTGFAPFKSIVEDLLKRGNQRRVHLYWGGRRPRDCYFGDLPQKWAACADWFKFVPVLSEPGLDWNGATGLVHHAVLRDFTDLSEFEVYACGNPGMIRLARRDFVSAAGLDESDFYADPFVPSGNDPAIPG
jgi:NAD(P)H-flavin reductase/ferredoxin